MFDGVERGIGDVDVAAEVGLGLDRVELDHAAGRVAAEQGALRSAQHFDLVQIENGKALENRVFLHDVVVDERDGLRRVQAKIAVAVAANVEAREGAAERRLDVETRDAPGQQAHVLAAGGEHIEIFAAHGRHRIRHVADVLGPAFGGDESLLPIGRCGSCAHETVENAPLSSKIRMRLFMKCSFARSIHLPRNHWRRGVSASSFSTARSLLIAASDAQS